MEKKIYAGSGKKKSDTWLSISINVDKIKDHIQEYNGNKFVKLNVNISKEADKYGKDVQVTVDTYNPEGRQSKTPAPQRNTQQGRQDSWQAVSNDDSGNLPF